MGSACARACVCVRAFLTGMNCRDGCQGKVAMWASLSKHWRISCYSEVGDRQWQGCCKEKRRVCDVCNDCFIWYSNVCTMQRNPHLFIQPLHQPSVSVTLFSCTSTARFLSAHSKHTLLTFEYSSPWYYRVGRESLFQLSDEEEKILCTNWLHRIFSLEIYARCTAEKSPESARSVVWTSFTKSWKQLWNCST